MERSLTPAAQAVYTHLCVQFPGQGVALQDPWPGPIRERVPDLRIARLDVGGWLYVTVGLWDAWQQDGHGLEFVLHAPMRDDRHIETLTMAAYYHAGGGDDALRLGHTVPIGHPWLPGSACDHLLVSLPYLWGPSFETCDVPGGRVSLLWLLPITLAEKRFRHEYGLEALEQRFDDAAIIAADPGRGSVV